MDSRDAVTLLNIIYNHVLPGTTFLSGCWAAQGENLSSTLNNNQQLIQHPTPTRENLLNVTYTVQVDPSSETNGLDLNQQVANSQVEFETQYRSILNDFIASNEPQFACPSTLTKDQRKIVHKLASDFQLKSESKGNWKKKTLFI